MYPELLCILSFVAFLAKTPYIKNPDPRTDEMLIFACFMWVLCKELVYELYTHFKALYLLAFVVILACVPVVHMLHIADHPL